VDWSDLDEHKGFSSILKTMMGKNVKPIIANDAGFKTPDLKMCWLWAGTL
jgi:hypothetical protein